MHSIRPSTPARILPAAAVLALGVLLVPGVASPLSGQAGGALVPARVSPQEFRGLRWLEGTWRGGMSNGGAFYERYALVDDSTFAVLAFPDSTLSSPKDIGRVSLRGGVVYREEGSGERVPATRLDAAGILFGTIARGFTWAPGPDGSWTAIIHGTDRSGARRETVYRMEPYDPVAGAIRRQADAFSAAFERGDPAAMTAVYTDDAVLLPASGPRRGRAAILEFWSRSTANSSVRMLDHTLTTDRLEVEGDLAVEEGTWSNTLQRGDEEPRSFSGKYLVVWRRGPDGVWRMQFDMWHSGTQNRER